MGVMYLLIAISDRKRSFANDKSLANRRERSARQRLFI